MRLPKVLAITSLFACTTAPCNAQSFDIHAPEVSRGALEGEALSGINLGDPRTGPRNAHEFKLGYGVSDRWMLEVGALVDKSDGEATRLARLSFESISVLIPVRKEGLALGWFNSVEVATSEGIHNALITGPLLHWSRGPTSLLVNPFVEKTFGRGAEPGFDFSYIWRGKTEVAHGLALGSMGFGRITNIAGSGPSMQDHRVGPALFLEAEIEPGRHVEIGIGAFAGIGRDSPDASVMFNVGVPLVPGRH
ncbi:MAG: hypothetical protein EKK41_26765 [Hyphomicrobiales bacterium]|nr:MAG: hypothetical protein EKK41_26765 [Hyphomicrobiales bacterium]